MIGNAIRFVQKQSGFAPEDAIWEHAAIYVGDGMIAETSRGGSRSSFLNKYVPTHQIRVRRAPNLNAVDGWRVAVQALIRLDFGYSYLSNAALLWNSRKLGKDGPLTKPTSMPKRARICSQLCAEAFMAATNRSISSNNEAVTPASLSATHLLVDLNPLSWCPI